tara:strand:- start:58 stop:579 length:522 start_codon:yes stop_codon:yes gene_type:complete
MKTFLSILLVGFTVAVSSQNEEINNVIQQHVNLDNNSVNYSKNPSIQINTRNINLPYTAATQKVRKRGNSSNSYSPNIELPQVDLSVNLKINVPSINLNINHVRQEKVKQVNPKRAEDFRIKTGNSSSSSVSHKHQKEHKSFQKKVLKPIKCWMQRTFKRTAKFRLSCACFQF